LQMPTPQAVIDAQGPDFEVGEDTVCPRGTVKLAGSGLGGAGLVR
jgi:hypothetical protein